MPPSTSIRETLLTSMITGLRAINGGSTFWNDFSVQTTKVDRVLHSLPPVERPFVWLEDLGDEVFEEVAKSSYTLKKAFLNFRIWLFSEDGELTRGTTENKLFQDVQAKFGSETVRVHSGNAIDTTLDGIDRPETDQAISPFIAGAVRGRIWYQYKATDPSSIT